MMMVSLAGRMALFFIKKPVDPNMDGAKIQLSQEERTLLMNPGWILTKNSIMGKVGELLAGLSEDFRSHFPEELIARMTLEELTPQDTGLLPPNWASPKISKGENYKGLPWMVLDYPRAFGRQDVLAIRTLFWWGHYFSVTLHLKGRYRNLWLPVIRGRIALLAKAGFHVGVSDDEWRHELDTDSYLPLREDMHTVIGKERLFLKLSARCELDRWDDASSVLLELFRVLVEVLTTRDHTSG